MVHCTAECKHRPGSFTGGQALELASLQAVKFPAAAQTVVGGDYGLLSLYDERGETRKRLLSLRLTQGGFKRNKVGSVSLPHLLHDR